MHMDSYKRWNIVLLVILSFISVGVWVYWRNFCTSETCRFELTEYFMRPVLWGSLALAITSGALVMFPSLLFKQWCTYIFSWVFPLALWGVLETDPRSSDILSLGRGQVAWLWGMALFAVTVLYVVGWYSYHVRKKDRQNLSLSHLIYLLPFIIILALD